MKLFDLPIIPNSILEEEKKVFGIIYKQNSPSQILS